MIQYNLSDRCRAVNEDSDFIVKIRQRSEDSFLLATSSAKKPLALMQCNENGIHEKLSFLPPSLAKPNQFTSEVKSKNRKENTKKSSSRTFPSCGPTDFSHVFSSCVGLPSGFRFPLKRQYSGEDRPSGENIVASCYRDGLIAVYDIRMNRPAATINNVCTENETHCIELANFSCVNKSGDTKSHADQTHILVGDGSYVRIVDLRKLDTVGSLDFHNDIVTDIKACSVDSNSSVYERNIISCADDGALILSKRTLGGEFDYVSSLSMNAPLRKVCPSLKGGFIAQSSVEEVFDAHILEEMEEEMSFSLRNRTIVKRFSESAYIADLFWATALDFTNSWSTNDMIRDVPIFCVGYHSTDDKNHATGIDICTLRSDSEGYCKMGHVPTFNDALVRSVQPFSFKNGKLTDNLLLGDEDGYISLWKK